MKSRKILIIVLGGALLVSSIAFALINNNSVSKEKGVVSEKVKEEEEKQTYPIKDKDGKYGLIDEKGNIIIEPKYGHITPFHNGVSNVLIDGKDAVIDREENIVVEPKYKVLLAINDGYIIGKNEELSEDIYDKEGNLLFENKNEYASYLENDYFVITNSENIVKLIKKDGEVIIPYEENYNYIGFANENIIIAANLDEYFNMTAKFLDMKGKQLIEGTFESASFFKEGLSIVSKNDKFGAIDEKGNQIIDFKFDGLTPFEEGVAIAIEDGKHGLIDKSGEYVVEPKYDDINSTLNNKEYYIVSLGEKTGLINKKGEIKIPVKYDYIYGVDEGKFKVVLDQKMGFFNSENEVILPVDNYEATELYNNVVVIQKDNKVYLVDIRSNELIMKDTNFTVFTMPGTKDKKILEVVDENSNRYYINTESCKVVYDVIEK